MKLKNVFKKDSVKKRLNNSQVLNKAQLEKVVGGADTLETSTTITPTEEGKRLYGPGQAHWGNA